MRCKGRDQVRCPDRLRSLSDTDQVLLVLAAEVQLEVGVVVIDDVEQGGEPSVVEEAALLMRPQSREGAVRYMWVGERSAWNESMPISLGVFMLCPGPV
jgi:hypothetical protein